MKTQQELQDRITPEFIKWCCKYAEGFTFEGESEIFFNGLRCDKNIFILPLLLHRTVEGWNKHLNPEELVIFAHGIENQYNQNSKTYWFKDYLGTTLTLCECAILHCLLDVFEEVGR